MDYESLISEIDPREVLRHLNELGIKNLSGKMLRDFIYDLKKFIKYDLYYKNNKNIEDDEVAWPERLHMASTYCSRGRSKTTVKLEPCQRDFHQCIFLKRLHSVRSAPNVKKDPPEVQPRRSCSCPQLDRNKQNKRPSQNKISSATSSNFIKVPIPLPQKKDPSNDPVSLYHYYLQLWQKYKPSLPGENSWSEIRWAVRQNLAGAVKKTEKKRVKILGEAELEKRRQGWVE